jgi:hypothetical protein
MVRLFSRGALLIALLALSLVPAAVSATPTSPTGGGTSPAPLSAVSPSVSATASAITLTGRLWAYDAANSNAPMRVWNLPTDTLATTFTLRIGDFWGNGRGVAFDPTDGNIWNSVVSPDFTG